MRGRGSARRALQHFDWIKQQMRRPVRPRLLEFESHLTRGCQTEPVSCDGRRQHVSADPFETLALTRSDEDARMKIEAVLARVIAPERGRLVLLGLGSESAHARARPVAGSRSIGRQARDKS